MASGVMWTDKEEIEHFKLLFKEADYDRIKLVMLYKNKVTANEWDKVVKKLKCGDPTRDE